MSSRQDWLSFPEMQWVYLPHSTKVGRWHTYLLFLTCCTASSSAAAGLIEFHPWDSGSRHHNALRKAFDRVEHLIHIENRISGWSNRPCWNEGNIPETHRILRHIGRFFVIKETPQWSEQDAARRLKKDGKRVKRGTGGVSRKFFFWCS